jgi:tetratricopeptide (TPR) repeat protein
MDLDMRYVETEEIERYKNELTTCYEKGDWRNVAYWSGTIAHVYSDLGQLEKAYVSFETALINSRKIKERLSEIIYLSNLGSTSFRMGQLDKAINHYKEALAISRKIRNRASEGNCLGGLALAYSELGDTKSARELYEEAIIISQKVGDHHNKAIQLSNLGSMLIKLGDIPQAIIYLEEASSILEESQPDVAELNRKKLDYLKKALNS